MSCGKTTTETVNARVEVLEIDGGSRQDQSMASNPQQELSQNGSTPKIP